MTDLYFVREEELALDNAGHLVRFHSQICQPLNDSQSTNNILLVHKQQGSRVEIAASVSVYMVMAKL